MEKIDILKQLSPIFSKVFSRDDIVLTESTSAADIEEWDSITHIQIIVGVEKQFKIKLTASDVRAFKNVGGLCEAIKSKIP